MSMYTLRAIIHVYEYIRRRALLAKFFSRFGPKEFILLNNMINVVDIRWISAIKV